MTKKASSDTAITNARCAKKGTKVYLVFAYDTKTDMADDLTMRAFSSRTKQIEYLNEQKETFGSKSGARAWTCKTLLVL